MIAIAVVNQKGGVAKTTTAVALAGILAREGYAVLLVDMDPQGNGTTHLGFRNRRLEKQVYDILHDQTDVDKAVYETRWQNLYLIPANLDLAGAEVELISEINRESRLKFALEELARRSGREFDFCFIDCPPSLSVLTLNALVAADYCIVPIECDPFSLDGILRLLDVVDQLRRYKMNPALKLLGFLLTRYDARRTISETVKNQLREHFGRELVFDTVIGQDAQLVYAASEGDPICYYNKNTQATKHYQNLAQEVLARVEEGKG